MKTTALRILGALVGGVLLYFASPPRETWWLAPIGIALLCLVCHGRRARAGFGYGLLFGLAWMLPLFRWLWDFLGPGYGPWPWLGVVLVCSLLFALPCVIIALTSTHWSWPLFAAASFVVGEAIRLRWPIGGFPWSRVAFSQPAGPLLDLAAIGGAPLVTFATALCGAGLAVIVRAALHKKWTVPGLAFTAVPIVLGLLVAPLLTASQPQRDVRVLVIQGSGPNVGLKLLDEGDVLWQRNLSQTEQVARELANGTLAKPDLVLVGESVADLPGTEQQDLGKLAQLADLVHAPVVVGSRSLPPHGPAYNVMVGYDPKTGKTGQFVKHHLAPYGEFVPLRSIARLFTPFLDRTSDMTPGKEAGVIPAGGARLGVAICFDVAYDDVLRQETNAGADLLTVPSNNAWFGDSEMTYQQQAMARIRAVEHDRAVVVAATTGSSALIEPDGRVVARTGTFQATSLAGQVPLRTSQTVADKVGAWSEGSLSALGLVGLVFGVYRRRSSRRSDPVTDTAPSTMDSQV